MKPVLFLNLVHRRPGNAPQVFEGNPVIVKELLGDVLKEGSRLLFRKLQVRVAAV